MKKALRVGGFVPCSTQDWPGQLTAVVFVRGCPWRCGYCHNPHLQSREWAEDGAWDDILVRLGQRLGLLDGVVFSGGEPTTNSMLGEAIEDVRALGMRTALHTAGCYPQRLAPLLSQVDWVGLDIKANASGYDAVTQTPGSGQKAWESLRLIQESGVPFEVRITAHPDWLPEDELLSLLDQLAHVGVTEPVLQAVRATATFGHGTPAGYLQRILERGGALSTPVLRGSDPPLPLR